MSEERDDIELIEAFLNNELDDVSMNAFRRRLEEEPELKSEVESFQYARKSVMNQGLKMKLQEIQDSLPENKSKSSSLNWKWTVGIAASLIISISSYLLFFTSHSGEQLYKSYFVPYPVKEVKRGASKESDKILNQYAAKDYATFVASVQDVLINQNDTLRLLYANANMELGLFSDAESTLLNISSNSKLYSSAQWYIALLSVRKGDVEKAIKILSSDLIKNSSYQFKAATLNQELKKSK